MSPNDAATLCPDCNHLMLWHRTTYGCTKIVRAQRPNYCGCQRRSAASSPPSRRACP